MPFDPLNPITMPVCVAGVRVLAAINSDEVRLINPSTIAFASSDRFVQEETTSKEAPAGSDSDWTPSIRSHLQRQKDMVNVVFQRMRWQISEQGRQDLGKSFFVFIAVLSHFRSAVSRLTSFLPIYTNFARSYAAKISEYFNDSHDENP